MFGKWMEILLEGLPSGNLAWLWNITILKRDGIYVSSNSMGHGFHNLPFRKLLVNFFLFFAHKNLQGTSRTGTKRKQRKPQNLLALTVWMRAFQTPGTQWLLMHSSAHMPEKQANAVHPTVCVTRSEAAESLVYICYKKTAVCFPCLTSNTVEPWICSAGTQSAADKQFELLIAQAILGQASTVLYRHGCPWLMISVVSIALEIIFLVAMSSRLVEMLCSLC